MLSSHHAQQGAAFVRRSTRKGKPQMPAIASAQGRGPSSSGLRMVHQLAEQKPQAIVGCPYPLCVTQQPPPQSCTCLTPVQPTRSPFAKGGGDLGVQCQATCCLSPNIGTSVPLEPVAESLIWAKVPGEEIPSPWRRMAWQTPGCQLGVGVAASSFLPALPSPCPYLPNYALGFSLATCPGTGGWKESFSFLSHKLVEDGKHRCQRPARNALAPLLRDGGPKKGHQPDGASRGQKQSAGAH